MDLRIMSYEGHIYLVEQIQNGKAQMLVDENHSPQRFSSINLIKQKYGRTTLGTVTLEQHTPYDEMCGLQETTEPLSIELYW